MSKVPILVISCDAYSDLWSPFFELFFKRWPDCPYEIYLGTNNGSYDDTRVNTITIGEDRSWCDNVRAMLDKLESDHFILFLEDFFIKETVDTAHIKRLVDIAVSEDVGCLRLAAGLPQAFDPSVPVPGHNGIGCIEKGEPYRVSAQVAVWKTSTIRKLLRPGYNAWQFEDVGTYLCEDMDDEFWAVYEPAIIYDHGVEKGKWKPEGMRICREAGVDFDTNPRGEFSQEEFDALLGGRERAHDYYLRNRALELFIKGDRTQAYKNAREYLNKYPLSFRMWLIMAFGTIGRGPAMWLKKRNVDRKLRNARQN